MRLIGESDLDSTKWETISDWVRYPCSFVPSFPLGRSLIALVQIQNVNNRCLNGVKPEFLIQVCTELVTSISTSTEIDPVYLTYAECCSSKYVASDIALCDLSVNIPCHNITSLYTWNKLVGINIDLIWMACTFLFYIVILMLLELKVFARLWAKIHKAKKGAQTTESILDSDVDTEKKRIKEIIDNGQNLEDHVLLVNELCKQFNKNMIAVNDLSFGVKIGQCFGLLGVNGAGKTTTFKMLTGDETLTDGSTYLLGNII
jgi:ATP-binding cassette subfamily A (ABC1) protein 3